MNQVELNINLTYIDMLDRECEHTKSMPQIDMDKAIEIVSKEISTFLAFNHKKPIGIQIYIK